MNRKLILLFTIALSASCQSAKRSALKHGNQKKVETSLNDATIWQLTQLNEKAVKVNDGLTMKLLGSKAVLSGGCNNGSARIELDRNSISFSDILSTEMACMPTVKQQLEQEYFNNLQKVNSYTIKPGSLALIGPSVKLLFIKKPLTQDSSVLNTKWKLTSIYSGEVVMNASFADPAFFILSNQSNSGSVKNLTGFTGCSNITGLAIVLYKKTMFFLNLRVQKSNCNIDSLKKQKLFLKTLQNAGYFQINKTMLSLYNKNKTQLADFSSIKE